MDKHTKGAAFSRPPPTSPKGHPKKKQRRDGPPGPGPGHGPGPGPGYAKGPRGDDHWSSRPPPPPSPSPSTDHFSRDNRDDRRDSRPPLLGGYVVRNAPPGGSELKIRGRSVVPTESDTGGDESPGTASDQEPAPAPLPTSFRGIENAYFSAADAITSDSERIDSYLARFKYPPNHPVSRATAAIRDRVDRLSDVFHSLANHCEGMAADLDRLSARENGLKRDLEDARGENVNLSRTRDDLADKVHALNSTARETDAEVRRLRCDARGLESKHGRLEADYRTLQEGRKKMATEKLWLEDTIRKQEADIEKAELETRRLHTLDEEKDSRIEGLQSDKLGLHGLVQQREAEVESLKRENARLQGIVGEKEARLALLAAVPATPLSPPRQFFPAAQSLLPALPARQGSPGPYIKQEAPEQTALALPADLPAPSQHPPYPPPASPLTHDDPTHLSNLATGAATVLTTALSLPVPLPSTPNPILASFLTNLGAATVAPVPRAPTRRPWRLCRPWSTTALPRDETTTLRPTLEERFAQLCLLFPFPGSATSSVAQDTFPLLTDLLASLTEANFSASPQPGWAFLRAVSDTAFPSHSSSQTPIPADRIAPTALAALLLCELCRVLEETFGYGAAALSREGGEGGEPAGWGLESVLGGVVAGEVARGVVGRLVDCVAVAAAAAAAGASGAAAGVEEGLHGEGEAVAREMVSGGRREGFCCFAMPATGGRAASVATLDGASHPTEGGKERQIGLLHCGGESNEFIVLDFAARTVRVVDCRMAGMRPNGAEPRKLDLLVTRPLPVVDETSEGEEGGEELFKVEAAPREVAAFWLRYAMVDV